MTSAATQTGDESAMSVEELKKLQLNGDGDKKESVEEDEDEDDEDEENPQAVNGGWSFINSIR
jgi:hypothetical protein